MEFTARRDWFCPLWRDGGRAEVMNRFFRQLARHFPRDDPLPWRSCGIRRVPSRPARPG